MFRSEPGSIERQIRCGLVGVEIHAGSLSVGLCGRCGRAAKGRPRLEGLDGCCAPCSRRPKSGLSRYLDEIRRCPMLEPAGRIYSRQALARTPDGDAAHRLVTSHLRLVAKIAMGYRGYGLPIGEVISEGNIGLMQAVKRFDGEGSLRHLRYVVDSGVNSRIYPALVEPRENGHHRQQKKLFFNLRKAKSQISALEDGDLHPIRSKRSRPSSASRGRKSLE